jgi:transcriptional antiterminator RfaH
MAPFWAVVQLQPQREAFALSMLARADFTVYAPRLREWRTVPGKGRSAWACAFSRICLPARSLAVARREMVPGRDPPGNGRPPSGQVPDAVIEEIRNREHNGAIEIPLRQLQAGDRVRILSGPFNGQLAIYAGMSGPERVAVLLQPLGGAVRVTLASEQVEMLALADDGL